MLVEGDVRVKQPSFRHDGPHSRECLSPRPAICSSSYLVVKYALDFFSAFVLITLAAPVIFLAAALVRLTSRGPAFYSQTRVGRNGRPYAIYKVRTMVHNCESMTGARWSTPGDPRITWIGWFLRRSHVDELPQLWNVLRGEMSLLGPRPERPEFVHQLERVVPHYRDRLLIRPGLSGLAQVQLPPDTDLESVRRKLAYDLYYMQHASLALDLRIMLSTIGYLLGIPVPVLRVLFQVPGGETVERAYEDLQAKSAPVAHLQPV